MERIRGRLQRLEVPVAVGPSAVYQLVLELSNGRTRAVQFTTTREDVELQTGDLLEVRLVPQAQGEEAVLVRNLTRRHLVLDQMNFEANRIALWVLAILVVIGLLLYRWLAIPRPGPGIMTLGALSRYATKGWDGSGAFRR